MADKVKVTQIKSGINRLGTHRRTLKALGITGINQSRVHELTPQIKGMLDQVRYLIRVEEQAD